jgi:hypothetical protein
MRIAVVAFMVLTLSSTAAAQTPSQPATNPDTVNSFRPLFRERETLIDRQADLQKGIDELAAKLQSVPPIQTLEQSLQAAQADLQKATTRQDSSLIRAISQYITTTQASLALAKDSVPALQAMRSEQARNARQLTTTEQRIASLFDNARDTNRFRLYVTIAFAAMVLIVITGFYAIVWKKHEVAATIFSGEMGMQFVTLFLIVIAIILFGIMGTLEGKELAALLGGLSGYILGRAAGPRTTPPPEANP